MPDFFEEYIGLKQYKLDREKEKKPDPATDPRKFVDEGIEDRKLGRKDQNMRELLKMNAVSLPNMQLVAEKVFGKERADKYLATAYKKADTYRKWVLRELEKTNTGLYNEVQDAVQAGKDEGKTIQEMMDAQKIPKEILDQAASAVMLHEIINSTTQQTVVFLREYQNMLSPKLKESLAAEQAKYKDILDRPLDERLKKVYKERTEELKGKIPEDMDAKEREDYEAVLDFASSHITVPDKQLVSEMSTREQMGYQKVEASRTAYYTKQNKENYKGGKYNDLHEKKSCRNSDYHILKKDREEDMKSLLEDHVSLSETTKNGIRAIFAKMDEMNIMDYGVEKNGESANKIYGFNRLMKEKADLEAALKKGDPKEITEAGNAYKKTWGDMEELYKIVKDHFSMDDTLFPGNMDSVRNASIPHEFTGDLKTTAQFNSVFLMYATLKQNNLDLESYLENPAGNIYKSLMKKMEDSSFEKQCQGLNFDQTLDFLTGTGKFHNTKINFTLNNVSYGDSRSMLGPTLLEHDENIKIGNFVLNDKLEEIKNLALNNQDAKLEFLAEGIHEGGKNVTPEQDKAIIAKTLENLLVASDKDRNLNACLGGLPQTDMYGRVIGEAFDADKYIKEKPADYEGIISRAQKIHKKCTIDPKNKTDATGIRGMGKDEYLELAQKTFLKILNANEIDKGSAGYEKLAQELMGMSKKLSAEADPKLRERMEAVEERFAFRHDPENVMDSLTASADNAQKNVHLGSKQYDNAVNSLKSLQEDIKNYKQMSKDASFDDRRAAIEEIRAKIEKVKEDIDLYMERKRKQGKSIENADEKGKKRIGVMMKAQSALGRIEKFLDDQNIEIDRQEVAKFNELPQTKEMEEAAAKSEGLDKIAAKYAADGYRLLQDTVSKAGPMSAKDVREIKTAFAAIAFQKALTGDMGDQIRRGVPGNMKMYKEQLVKISASAGFEEIVGNLSRKGVDVFLKDPKAPAALEKKVAEVTKKAELEQKKLKENKGPEKKAVETKNKPEKGKGPVK